VLTQLLVELIRCTKHQKKIVLNLISSKTKTNNYYLGPILNIMFRKWFPINDVHSPRIAIPEEPMSPTNQK
jgi:hypothetical protein